jgi:hypothetical protein
VLCSSSGGGSRESGAGEACRQAGPNHAPGRAAAADGPRMDGDSSHRFAPAPPRAATLRPRARCGRILRRPAPGTAAGRQAGRQASRQAGAGDDVARAGELAGQLARVGISAGGNVSAAEAVQQSAAAFGPSAPTQTCWHLLSLTVSDISSSRRTTATVGGARTTSPTNASHLRSRRSGWGIGT